MGRIGVGDVAPDFTLPDAEGAPVRLAELLRTGPVVIFFYPRDGTAGCTAEACAFRDAYSPLLAAGAQVLGVSADDADAHGRFAARHRLPFRLLSDGDGAVRRAYGVPRTLGLLPGRVTYVIDRHGLVRHIFASQFAVARHAEEALRAVRGLAATPALTACGR